MCETEILLSLDGGRTTYMRLTESRNPRVQYFDWIVPNAPTNKAVLDIRFGCLNIYPETQAFSFNPFCDQSGGEYDFHFLCGLPQE